MITCNIKQSGRRAGMFRSVRQFGSLFLVIALVLAMTGLPVRHAEAAGNTHYLAFASDYHAKEGSIEKAMKGLPEATEYVSLLGGMTVEQEGDATASVASSGILKSVKAVFPNLKEADVSVVCGDHDYSVNDDAGIIKCKEGQKSGLICEGKNSDNSTAYYIYGISYDDMTVGGTTSKEAAAAFKTWVGGITDKNALIIAVCHAPVQALRGDNNGAMYWNEALNYAATGKGGIISTKNTGTVERCVLFLHGHNCTTDQKEYYFPAGGTMKVQVDGSSEESDYSANKLEQNGAELMEDSGDGGASEDTAKATGVQSVIYYTSLTPGYLSTNETATLLTIQDDSITLKKYNDGEQVSLGTNGSTGTEAGKEATVKQVKTEHSVATVTKTDANGKAISGAEFTLYNSDNKAICTYSNAGSFSISTADGKLAEYLPDAGGSTTLTLKETKAPSGYSLSDTKYNVVLKNTVDSTLNNGVYETKTTYSVTISGKTALNISNTLSGSSSSSSGTKKSSSTVKDVPKTGDPMHPAVYAAAAVLAVLALAGLVIRKRRQNP